MNDKFLKIFKAYLKGELLKFLNQEITIEFTEKYFIHYNESSVNVVTLSLSHLFSEPFSLIFADAQLTLCVAINSSGFNCTIHCTNSHNEYQLFSDEELEKNGLKQKFDEVYSCIYAIEQTTQTV